MTESNGDTITLAYAFESVELTSAQASTILQWLGQQMAGTDAGDAIRDAGIKLGQPEEPAAPPTSTSSATTKPASTTSSTSSTTSKPSG